MNPRLIQLLSILALALSLAACGSAPATPGAANPTAAVAAATAAPPPTTAPATAVAVIPTTDIIKAYETDQARADAQYQGQTLTMIGQITNINDVFGTQALLLRDSENDPGLQCYLTDAADAAKVSIGQTVTIEGTIKGGELGFFMVAEPCKVVNP